MAVGIRELKDKLSFYLRQVEKGQEIEVAKRGRVIALLIPARGKRVHKGLWALVAEGIVSWKGGKPRGASPPVQGRGRPLSELIVEDRR
ncbi:MAG: hypothetical protein KatS3mg131_2102 [Candidatus Tectimicrobiota bacterium]|nr:MAG: hypothetical protein KatS3mg131_2102 [Candidatus Tectomicrobia bacterium]